MSEAVQDPLPPLGAVIAKYKLSARRALGQNFLLDLNLTRRIARAALDGAETDEEKVVYEVGPGPGGLTRALLAEGASRVIAIERDARALPALAEIQRAYPGRFDFVSGDAMAADEALLLEENGVNVPVRVAANLPYNVGTALLVKWLTVRRWPTWWSVLTLTFQREVGERICARPGDDAYGRLSVLTQWRAEPRILFDINPRAFVPPPKVTSSVVRIDALPDPRFDAELDDLEAVTAAAFGQRRKMIRKSLKKLTPDAEDVIRAALVPPMARAEDLDLSQYCALARAFRASR
ncbi:MAG: 16S rRNA (adenine(1518)-N(6)/adenine(1519)-N(6))-dimethyltransferase RsmA [Alphaproteobacteria bacterium]